jgi:hypothetical protein
MRGTTASSLPPNVVWFDQFTTALKGHFFAESSDFKELLTRLTHLAGRRACPVFQISEPINTRFFCGRDNEKQSFSQYFTGKNFPKHQSQPTVK